MIDHAKLCAFKLNLLKTYDMVDRYYLEDMLLALEYSTIRVKRIMFCVNSVKISYEL